MAQPGGGDEAYRREVLLASVTPVVAGGVVPRPTVTTLERPIALGDDPAALRGVLTGMVNASGLTQHEISRRMGVRANTVNQFLMGRAMTKPSVAWVSRLVCACGGRLWVEYPKR